MHKLESPTKNGMAAMFFGRNEGFQEMKSKLEMEDRVGKKHCLKEISEVRGNYLGDITKDGSKYHHKNAEIRSGLSYFATFINRSLLVI